MTSPIERADTFLRGHARVLERRLFDVIFRGAPVGSLVQALRAYVNADGGLGHALEPDLRCSESQPLFVEFGLEVQQRAGCRDASIAQACMEFLARNSEATQMLPLFWSNALRSPRAPHFTNAPQAGLNPTAGICGLLWSAGVSAPWLEDLTQACTEHTLLGPPPEAHTLLCIARLAESHPDRAMANKLVERIASALPAAAFFIPFAPVTGYGLTPLHLAPSPKSVLRSLFTDAQIVGHLDDLLGHQQADGGWPVTWQAPSPAAQQEARGIVTVSALCALRAYSKI